MTDNRLLNEVAEQFGVNERGGIEPHIYYFKADD